jgi:hypothetical protein
MFDEQIDKILLLIDKQLEYLQWKQPGSRVVSVLYSPLLPYFLQLFFL